MSQPNLVRRLTPQGWRIVALALIVAAVIAAAVIIPLEFPG